MGSVQRWDRDSTNLVMGVFFLKMEKQILYVHYAIPTQFFYFFHPYIFFIFLSQKTPS